MLRPFGPAVLLCLSTLVLACGGGGGGGSTPGTAQPLSIPQKLTVVDAQQSGAQALRLGIAGSDFEADQTETYIHDESMEPVDLVNDILHSLSQTGYDHPDVLNQGPYSALIEMDEDEPDGGSQQGSQGDGVELELWVVESTRAGPDAPQIVRFWIDWEEEDGPGGSQPARLYGHLTINASPTSGNPYGDFVLNFALLPRSASPSSTATLFEGTLRTAERQDGRAEITIYMVSGGFVPGQLVDGSFRMRARLVTDAGGDAGQAISSMEIIEDFGQGVELRSTDYDVAFNARYLARQRTSGGQSLEVLDRMDFSSRVYRYGLYDAATEARVARESGFGIRSAGGAHGWADHNGLWFPDDAGISAGATVTRAAQGDGDPTTYTVFESAGRMLRETRVVTDLGNLKGEEMHYYDPILPGNTLVSWDGQDLMRIAVDSSQGQWNYLQTRVSLNSQCQAGDWLGMWSDARGSVHLDWPSSAPGDSTPVVTWAQELMTPASADLAGGNLTLHAYAQMMKPLLSQAQSDGTGTSVFFDDAQSLGEARTYVLDATTIMLSTGGQEVRLADGVVPTENSPGYWGFWGGPMVTTPLTDLADLWDQPVTYRWETGARPWNRLRGLVDSQGDYVIFDAPLQFNYTHVDSGDPVYNGRTYQLRYYGFGDLHGIPWLPDSAGDNWSPAFNIATGTELTNSEGTFKIKVLEVEQRLQPVSDPSGVMASEGLQFEAGLTAPTDTWVHPGIGAMPAIAGAPLFIRGQRQE